MKPGMAKPKLDLIMLHLADRAGLDQLDQLCRLRMQPVHEGFAEKGAGLARRMDHRVGLEGGEPHRLFAKHMLAGLGRLDRPFGMARDAASRCRSHRLPGRRAAPRSRRGCGRRGKLSARPGLAGIARADRRQACRCANARRRRQRPWRWCRARGCPSGFFCGSELMFISPWGRLASRVGGIAVACANAAYSAPEPALAMQRLLVEEKRPAGLDRHHHDGRRVARCRDASRSMISSSPAGGSA